VNIAITRMGYFWALAGALAINSATGALTSVVGGAFDLAAFAPASGYSVAILSLL
jgi:hypothetical protein